MKTPLLALALSAIVSISASAQAPDAGNLKFLGDISSNGSFGSSAVGPYSAQLTGFSSLFDDNMNAVLWCVDFDHFAPPSGTADDYWATSVVTPFTSTYTEQSNVTLYQQAAWLIERYDAGAAGYTSAKDLQGTIWELFSPATFSGTGYVNLSLAGFNAGDITRNWYVLSDDTRDGENAKNQEFMYSTPRVPEGAVVPEPASLALVMLGLVGVGLTARRRLFVGR